MDIKTLTWSAMQGLTLSSMTFHPSLQAEKEDHQNMAAVCTYMRTLSSPRRRSRTILLEATVYWPISLGCGRCRPRRVLILQCPGAVHTWIILFFALKYRLNLKKYGIIFKESIRFRVEIKRTAYTKDKLPWIWFFPIVPIRGRMADICMGIASFSGSPD